jgi:site-specific recombinase XerD
MEVLSLRWSNVHLKESRLYLPFTKAGKPRFVAINSQALQTLTEMAKTRRAGCDWVFPSASEKGHLLEVRRTFETITEKAGITGLKLHDLRRSFASLLINSGVSIYEVRDLLGRSDVRTTQVYAHLDVSTLRHATETAAVELEKAMAS